MTFRHGQDPPTDIPGQRPDSGRPGRPGPQSVFGDTGHVQSPGPMLDEHQHGDATQQEGIHREEVARDDPLGLRSQELSPRRSRSAWRRVNISGAQDLPHRRRGNLITETGQLTLDATVPTGHSPWPDARSASWSPPPRVYGRSVPIVVVPLARHQSTVPGQHRCRGDGEDLGSAATRHQPRQTGRPHPIGSVISHAGDLTPQDRVLVMRHPKALIFWLHLSACADQSVPYSRNAGSR